MRRFVKMWPAAVAAGLMIAGPGQAAETGADGKPDQSRRGERWSRGRAGRAERERPQPVDLTEDEAVAAGVPPMFRDAFPDRAKRLEALSRSKPALYRKAVTHLHRLAADLTDLKTHDHEMYTRRWAMVKLRVETDELGDRRREAKSDAERAKIDGLLARKLGELFDAKENEQRLRITHLEEEITELKSRLERRKKLRAQMIERRMNELRADEPLEF